MIFPLKMVIFYSYVKLPEGTHYTPHSDMEAVTGDAFQRDPPWSNLHDPSSAEPVHCDAQLAGAAHQFMYDFGLVKIRQFFGSPEQLLFLSQILVQWKPREM